MNRPPANYGFKGMPKEKVKELAIKGGNAAQKAGTAHRWTPKEARAAGLKGIAAREANKKKKKEFIGHE